MSELLGRAGLAAVVLVLAAVAVTMSGGAGLGGSLGALFGLHTRQGGKPVSAIQVAAPATVQSAVASARLAPVTRVQRQPKKRTRPQSTPAPRRLSPGPGAPRPAPAAPPVAPQPPPVQAPTPPPPASGNVQHTVQTVRDTAAPLAPPAQPVLDQALQTVDRTCTLIGGCP
jgi:hypothetical protein